VVPSNIKGLHERSQDRKGRLRSVIGGTCSRTSHLPSGAVGTASQVTFESGVMGVEPEVRERKGGNGSLVWVLREGLMRKQVDHYCSPISRSSTQGLIYADLLCSINRIVTVDQMKNLKAR
jgi:hypothetical protein